MPTEYSTETGLTAMVEALIEDTNLDSPGGRDLSLLRTHEVRVTPVLCTREGSEGEIKKAKGRPINVRKVTDLEKALSPKLGDFLLVVDTGTFQSASEHQQRAMLYDALLLIDITTGQDGAIKMGKRQPDLVMNLETIRVFGICDRTTLGLSDIVSHAKKHAHLLMPPAEEEEGKPESKGKRRKGKEPESSSDENVDVTEEEPADDENPGEDEIEPQETGGEDGDIDEEAGKKPVKRRRG